MTDDPFELAIFLTQSEDDDDWEEAIYEKYGIAYADFAELISDLLPLIDMGKSGLAGKSYKGFADVKQGIFLARTEVSND